MIVLSWDFHCAACKDCCYLFVGVTALCLVQNYAVCKRHSMTLLYLYAQKILLLLERWNVFTGSCSIFLFLFRLMLVVSLQSGWNVTTLFFEREKKVKMKTSCFFVSGYFIFINYMYLAFVCFVDFVGLNIFQAIGVSIRFRI